MARQSPPEAGQEKEASGKAEAGGRSELFPRPKVKRLSRFAVVLAMAACFLGITFLAFRFSREGLSAQRAEAAPQGPGHPVEVRLLERMPARPTYPEREPFLSTDEPGDASEAPALEMPSPRPVVPAWTAPVAVHRPPSPRDESPLRVERPSSRGGAGLGEGVSATGTPSLEERLLSQALAASGGSAAPGLPVGTPSGPDPRQLSSPGISSVRAVLARPASPYLLRQGTYLEATLGQALSSELGGQVRAYLARDAYDSLTGRYLLLPRGSVLLGHQERQPLAGEERLVILWHRLLLPDGRSLELSSPQPAAGLDGSLGLSGKTRHHFGKRFGTALLVSLVGAGVQLSQPQRSADEGRAPSGGQVAAGEVGLGLGRLSEEILRRGLDIPPTVTLAPGARVHLLLTQDLVFDAPYGDAP